MKLVFYTEARFIKVGENYYSSESSFSYSLFERYLQYFENVVVCARTKIGNVSEVLPQNLVSKDRVKVYPLPYYTGFVGFLKRYLSLKRSIKQSVNQLVDDDSTVVCRLPGRIGAFAIGILKTKSIPYGIEVVGDPYDVLSNGATSQPFAPLIRFFSFRSLKTLARDAPAALYVTQFKLQERYPNDHFNIGVSDVVMPEAAFRQVDELKIRESGMIALVCVGTLDQMYKGPDIMLRALRIIIDKGYNVHLTWVGDGIFKKRMTELANTLGLSEHVTFLGKLPGGGAVIDKLDKSDIFVMPSRMEGLPRAMVEAMARGLPCVGTRLCGIQELIDDRFLVEVNDFNDLAYKIIDLVSDPELRKRIGARNLEKSLEFAEDVLQPKRSLFYHKLIELRSLKS